MPKPKSTASPKTALLEPPERAIDIERDYTRLTPADTALILQLADDGRSQPEIGKLIGCHHSTVGRCLQAFADTRIIARKRLAAGADTLAQRVLVDADVDQSLEMLDRLGVAERREQRTGNDSTVSILIGMPGQRIGTGPVIELTPTKQSTLTE